MERSTIHLLHKRGKSQREIARELGRSRATVARALAEPVERVARGRRRSKLTDPYRERIAGWVTEGLTAVRMFELARDDPEQPYAGQLSVFRAAVRRERQAQGRSQMIAAVPVRFEGLPGEYLQVDWGEIRHFPFTQQEPSTRYFLACRLKYSRWTWVRFTTEMRQETLFRGLVDCVMALGWVPWVLVFDNMKTVTTGRDAQQQPIWHPALLQLAAEFDFHPEACWPGAGNQKGSVESLVKWVKGNFLAGRVFADDVDLGTQCDAWLTYANTRPSQATDVAPLVRLVEEAAKGGSLPVSAADYGVAHPGQVSSGALVAVLGNSYSVPIVQLGAPVTARVHRERIVIWRDTTWLAEHGRAPDGAHRRVVDPTHFAPLFGRKPRAQVMLYREALLELGPVAAGYVGELSRRQRARLGEEILGLYALYERHGAGELLAAMAQGAAQGAYGVASLQALIVPPAPAREGITPLAAATSCEPSLLALADLPPQAEVDRALSSYESYVWIPDRTADRAATLVTLGEVLP